MIASSNGSDGVGAADVSDMAERADIEKGEDGTEQNAEEEEEEEEEDMYQSIWLAGDIAAVPLIRPSLPAGLSSAKSTEKPGDEERGQPGVSDLARRFFARFDERDIDALRVWANEAPVCYSTICSGTDSAALCHDAITNVLVTCGGAKLCIEQKFACEVNEQKRQFLRAVHPGLKNILGQA